jgi:hypothetical protein
LQVHWQIPGVGVLATEIALLLQLIKTLEQASKQIGQPVRPAVQFSQVAPV